MISTLRVTLAGFVAIGLACGVDTPQSPPEDERAFRNVERVAYVDDTRCSDCHQAEAEAYASNAMARSFHEWNDSGTESVTEEPLFDPQTGFFYAVIRDSDGLQQEEYALTEGGSRVHELRRSMDYVMGSGAVARTYFTEENGRLFQLPLTWYADHGWDFSPGYELNNPRFDRLAPDRCVACHASYPVRVDGIDGKYAELFPGIGCQRCHGPGGLHVSERESGVPLAHDYDDTIVNPAHLSIERRLDTCDQCHVHTAVAVLREGHDAFDYVPSRPLAEHVAYFKVAGDIDVVSHADRLRQSQCFLATQDTDRPLECATCHDPHAPSTSADASTVCASCHDATQLAVDAPAHENRADCVTCHMPAIEDRTVPHGSFTEHWIGVAGRRQVPPSRVDGPVEPYFERDRSGPEAALYRALGTIVFGNLASNVEAVRDGAAAATNALAGDTARPDAWFLLGAAHEQLGETDAAIPALETSLHGNPDNPSTLRALALAVTARNESADSADALFRRALDAAPGASWIRADYASFLQTQNRRSEAEAEYRRAISERPTLSGLRFSLGLLLTEQGRHEEAAGAFREALRLEPSLGEAISTLVQIRVRDQDVTGARMIGSPLTVSVIRAMTTRPVSVRVVGGTDPGIRFGNLPSGPLLIAGSDGRVLAVVESTAGAAIWDLRQANGRPAVAGSYDIMLPGPSGGTVLRSFSIVVNRTP